nr:AAA family ATPase [Natrarchaeobius chitinivorans]
MSSTAQLRTRERNRIESALEPNVAGEVLGSVLIFGRAGSGKTVTTRQAIDGVRRRSSGQVGMTWVDVSDGETSYQLAIRLLQMLEMDNTLIPVNRHDRETIKTRLRKKISEIKTPQILVIDGLDAITDPMVIHDWICRSPRHKAAPGPPLSLVEIVDHERGLEVFIGSVDDRSYDQRIEFEPFSRTGLMEILDTWIDRKGWAQSIEYGVVDMCAALIAQDQSNARRALALLNLTRTVAMEEGTESVTTTHVTRAYDRLQCIEVDILVADLSVQRRLVLLSLITVDERRMTAIYDRYRSLAREYGRPVLTERAVHDHLTELERDGVLTTSENRTGSPGNYHTYELLPDEPRLKRRLEINVDG